VLNRLEAIGCQAAYAYRRVSHELILTFGKQAKDNHVTAFDIAKRLLDYN
jgi:glycine dehydrogenase subunit 2